MHPASGSRGNHLRCKGKRGDIQRSTSAPTQPTTSAPCIKCPFRGVPVRTRAFVLPHQPSHLVKCTETPCREDLSGTFDPLRRALGTLCLQRPLAAAPRTGMRPKCRAPRTAGRHHPLGYRCKGMVTDGISVRIITSQTRKIPFARNQRHYILCPKTSIIVQVHR